MEIQSIIKHEEYSFLKENKNLGSNIILLGLAGSYAYGTNKYYAKQLGCFTRTITNLYHVCC